MNRVGMGLAIGAGYLLGRTKKLKFAFAVGSLVAGKRMHLSPRAIADLASEQLLKNPQFKEIGDQLRQDLRGVGKAASGAMVERQVEALADRLHGRTAEVRDQLAGVVPDTGLGSRDEDRDEDSAEDSADDQEPQEEYDEEDEGSEDEGSEDEGSEAEGSEDEDSEAEDSDEEPEPRRRPAAKKAPARKAPAKQSQARKAPAKKAASKQAPAKKAPAKKTAAKKTAGKKTAAAGGGARNAGRRPSKGGDER
ncbi:DNA primase [Streptomyces sp. NPDC087903]|uniref:DNA primase n=1 Tax=Streptomyces sp. NPDC087903 TaxID=3365819 RepID=UPI003822EA3C